MHLLIDIGNSTVVVATAMESGVIRDTWRFKTQKEETESYYRNEILSGFCKSHIDVNTLQSVTISSVVPEVNDDITQAVADITGIVPHFFCLADACKVIGIDVESPSQLGNDRLADAVAAVACYGAPVLVFDMGTATTVGVIDKERIFRGGMIIPGVKTSLSALSKRASQLPSINIETPRHIVGKNTLECMQSGILYGNAAMIDGIIDRIGETIDTPLKVVATGGMAKNIVQFCNHDIIRDDFLQFKGLFHAVVAKK